MRRHHDRHHPDYKSKAQPIYERIVTAVRGAPSLLVVGGATGKSSAAHVFLGHLEKHHRDLHDLVWRVKERDLSALTPADIAGMAREGISQKR